MSRWNTSGEWGEPEMQGDKIVHSAKKARHKDVVKGCPGNDHKAHFYVSNKTISVFTVDNSYGYRPDETVSYKTRCLFCGKSGYIKHRYNKPLPAGSVIDKTTVTVYGEYVRTGDFRTSGYRVLKQKTYDGDVDKHGNVC